MVEKANRILSKLVTKEVEWDNEWKEIKIQSTVDEGKGASFNEKAEHIFKQLKK